MFIDFPAGDKNEAGARIFEDKLNLFDGLSRVNRYIDSSQTEDREISYGPLWPVLRQKCNPVSGLYPEFSKSESNMSDPLNELFGGDVQPLAASLII
jgi:hypothetical protein